MFLYSLEAPHQGASYEYPQHMFLWRSKKKCGYPFITIRTIIKMTKQSRPTCSKLTTSLVNDSLKFTSNDMQIC